jgi:hypothetical protein
MHNSGSAFRNIVFEILIIIMTGSINSTCNRIFGIGLNRPWGFQEDEAPKFPDNRHMKVVRLSAEYLLSNNLQCVP